MKHSPNSVRPFWPGSGFVIGQALAVLLVAVTATAAGTKTLSGHVPSAIGRYGLAPLGRPAATDHLNLAIGLALHDPESLSNLFNQIYDPASTNYHRFLTSQETTERFGPTKAEYQSVIDFAEANGLTVFARYDNRLVVDVSGTVSQIEHAFHTTLRTYQHPTEARQFYAPDTEPSVDASLPILIVSGLDNYSLPHPNVHIHPVLAKQTSGTQDGSGPGKNYLGSDFRNAYAPGVSLTGAGQIVGLFEEDGYYGVDITNYEKAAGITPYVPLQNVVLDSLSGNPSGNTNAVGEVSLDIEMAMAMAPGLSKVVVFEGTNWLDILGSMLSHSEIKQLSCSWGFAGTTNAAIDNTFMLMGVEGQSFFLASGDGDAFVGDLMQPDDDPHITTVGGTALVMNGVGSSYASESVWNWNYDPPAWWYGGGGYWGSGGGISTRTPIPLYQQGISMASNGGSTTRRNVPDVALTATGIYVIYFNGLPGSFGGTSCAAPLWAGFTALANEQAVNLGQPALGFLNPALYQIAKGSAYTSCFNDVTTGNNTSSNSPSAFYAVPGYDLCTGLGTPNGTNMINALMPYTGYSTAVWVDYTYAGSIQNGTYDAPYTTLSQAVAFVAGGGPIWFRSPGDKAETMTISKPLSIHALSGPVVIGQ